MAPEATGVTVLNHKKVKVNFSEAVNLDTAGIYKTTDVTNSGALVKVDGQLSFAKFTAVPGEHAVEVEFFNELTDGSHTIEIGDVKDFAGFKSTSKSFTINTSKDVVAPTATGVEYLSPTSVKVTFSEALAGTTSPTGTFVVKEAGNSSNLVNGGTTFTLSNDKKSVTIAGLTSFTAAAIVGYDVTYKNVEDIFGNKLTADTTISSKVTDDSTKPTVANTEVIDGNVVKVTFSEKVNVSPSNFKLYKADGTTVVNAAASQVVDFDSVDPDGKTFKVSFAGLSNIDSATYKVEVSGVTDKSIRANAIEKVTTDIVAKDSKAPTLATAVIKADAVGNNDKIELVFSEAMDASTLANVSNYFIGNGAANLPLNTITGAKVDSVSADGKKVVLLVPDADNSNLAGGLAAAINRIALPALKDVTGNYVSNASISSPFTVAGSYTPATASNFTVEATGKNTIKVTAKDGYYFTAANANSFKIFDGSADVNLGIVAAQVSQDGTSVTLTTSVPLNADATLNAVGTPAAKLYITGTDVKDQNDQAIAFASGSAITVSDKIASSVASVAKKAGADDKVEVTFDEVIVKATGISNDILASNLTVTANGTALQAGSDYTVSTSGAVLTVDLDKAGLNDAVVTVALTNGNVLVDGSTNKIGTFAAKGLASDAKISTVVAPTVAAVANGSTSVAGTAEVGASVLVKDSAGNALGSAATVDSNGDFAATISPVSTGDVLTVVVTDVDGNVVTKTVTVE
ncbi:hypothetical protein ABE29_12890 [Cytobacillus firmus]|uniref:Ig-like domain-containing protein n=1 Tax=Cytobacillus firmus TaxID=1399 RepID=UPI00077C7D11|nr:Ig-like domain-containing protein [Cytobacillus firmus]MBG9543653.1 hypothetical protein [Cytobacillus firmus]MBG9554994.1 hypothetical protein [Cytobacillus firmus]MBG9558175.1 hypothetical protein [Cytobacillus firmus]MBG9575563.1 hypothetical protein [Cytobacillus firmus]MEC1894399.1 Ig-like domain-containing protein [Cytobacillus firmus]